MFVIESNDIRIEAETEREAMKQLKAEQRKRKRAADEYAANEAIAEEKARSRGFRILSRYVAGVPFPQGYYCISPHIGSVSVSLVRNGVYSIRAIDEDGTATKELHCYGVPDFLENASGLPLIVWIQDSIGTDPVPYAIAVHSNAIGIIPLPVVIQPSLFKR